MNSLFRITSTAAVLAAAVAWAVPADAAPWDAPPHAHHGSHWPAGSYGWRQVYVQPWDANGNGPLLVVYDVFVKNELEMPIRVREVRLHGDNAPAEGRIVTGNASDRPGPPRAGLSLTSSGTTPAPRWATGCRSEKDTAGLLAPAVAPLQGGHRTADAPHGPREF